MQTILLLVIDSFTAAHFKLRLQFLLLLNYDIEARYVISSSIFVQHIE